MDKKILLCSSMVLFALLVSAGCTVLSPPPNPPPVPTLTATIPVPTPVATLATPTVAQTPSTEPGPTQTMPPQWPLSVSVEKAGTYSRTIITHFEGGKGMGSVLRLDATLTRQDGQVVTRSIDKPKMGDIIEIEGTNGVDRIEVTVLMNSGQSFKIIDQQMQYKIRN